MTDVKFSLIIGTLDRPKCLDYCLDSLLNQSYKKFEVIVIDQSENDKSEAVVEKYINKLPIIYKHVSFKGLSKARNLALSLMDGNYFCLIDDDAFYPPNYLEKLTKYIHDNPNRIYSGYIWDTIKNKPFASYHELIDESSLSIRQIIRNCPSPALTFPASIVKETGYFDEDFGVGAVYGAGEETDYILRSQVKNKNLHVYYHKNLYIEHPSKYLNNYITPSGKSYRYSYGFGALYRKTMKNSCIRWQTFGLFVEQICRLLGKWVLGRDNSTKDLLFFLYGFKAYRRG